MLGKWIREPIGRDAAIFVHGILSSGDKCWRNPTGISWPELLKEESQFGELGIYVFTYRTGIFSGSFSVRDAADSLKEHMQVDGVLDCDRIAFVCHSMGGIVVRKFIVDQAIRLIQDKKEVGLFLVASPTLGAMYADWFAPLAYLLGHRQAEALRFVGNNEWLEDLDRQFTNLKEGRKLKLIGKELIEDKSVVLGGFWRRQVVEPFAGAKYFGDPYKVPGSDHFSISKPSNKDDIQHQLLCEFISDYFPPRTAQTPKESTSKLSSSDAVIRMVGMSAVDEEALEIATKQFGMGVPKITISWPPSCDKLISIMESAVARFDEDGANIVGSDFFMEHTPSAIASARQRRQDVEAGLPNLLRRAEGFHPEQIKAAVRNYVILGNFKVHQSLIDLCAWQGLKELGFEVPEGLASFKRVKREDAYARLFHETFDIYQGQLKRVGDRVVDVYTAQSVWLFASKLVLRRHLQTVSDPDDICRWLIPQVELDPYLGEAALPDKYLDKKWEFGEVRDRSGWELKGEP
jgi:hypothetical protein